MPIVEYRTLCKYYAEETPLTVQDLDYLFAQQCYVQAKCAGNKSIQFRKFLLFNSQKAPSMPMEDFLKDLQRHMGFKKVDE